MGKNKRTIVNLSASILVFVINVIISFWLSPYITEHIGVEANGFISLANNFVTYANLIVTALNGMASRFIAIEYAKKDYKKANIYYNSVFWGNLIICAVLIIPAICLIIFFENFFDVPPDILLDVKILFSFIFASFFLQTGAPNYNVGCYASNRLDREYIPQVFTAILKAAMIIGLCVLFVPHVWYVGLATFCVTSTLLLVNKNNTNKLTPELKIYLKRGDIVCSKSAIKELVGSGIWNSISSMGNILLSGLDLVICNALLGATAMGVLSLSKILALYLQQLSSSLTSAFLPEMTLDYAMEDKDNMRKNINRAMKITASIMTIAVAGIIIYSKSFFELWVPTQDSQQLAILSILSLLGYILTSGTQILYNTFTATNHVKENSIAMIISGVISLLLTFLLVKFTNLGIYSIVISSTVCNFIRNMSFTLPFSARYLGFKWDSFYPMCLRTLISTVLIGLIGYGVLYLIPTNSWLLFFVKVAITAITGLVVNLILMLSKEDKAFLKSKLQKKFKKQ